MTKRKRVVVPALSLLGPLLVVLTVTSAPDPAFAQANVFGDAVLGLVVLVVDFALVLRARASVTQFIIGATVAWLVTSAVEDSWKLGLAEVDFVRLPPEESGKLWSCPAPPCAISPTIS
eukprot:gene11156-18338_t